MVSVAEAYLRAHLPAPDDRVDFINTIVRCIASEREITQVAHISARFGIREWQLQRLFARYVGIGPKWVIQRYRLHEAIERLADGTDDASDTPVAWARFAQELGYFDQAHFIKDFKALVGRSPADYVQHLKDSRH